MEEIKPKKERKFLKAMGEVALTLVRDLLLNVGKKVINKVGNKRQGLVIVFLLVAGISYASIDSIPYPLTGNKQRLGWQTSGNGLVYRGRSNDTITKPSSYVDKNVKAYLLVDSVLGTIFVWRQTYWDSIKVNTRLMPFDSITFNTAKNGTVGVGEVEYNDTQGSLIQGLKGGNVTNVIGQQLHQRVNNRTGAPLAKGDVVYLAGSQGNRITVAKGLAVTDAFSANTFGVVAESIADNQSGFIITEGLITGLNTSALTEDSAVYLSPTVAGALTSTKPQAPQHSVYIGVCVKSNNGSGELFVKIRNGQELDELHDVQISSPVTNASLYYSGGLWRDTTPTLLVSDTAAMLANYATKAYADTTGRLYARQDYTTGVTTSTLTWTQTDTLIPGGVTFIQVYRNGQILLPSQYTVPTSTSVVISASSFKVNDNYTVIFPRGGGAGSGGGSGSLTSISGGTGILVSPNPITTTGTVSADLSVLMELTDTTLLNLTSRFASKLNPSDTISLSNRIDTKGSGTVTSIATGYGLSGGTITTSGTLLLDSATVFTRIRDSIVDVAIGNDTIKILKQEYAPALTSILTWTITPKFPIQLKAYILVFRNGQLLNNDQYNLTDTNKITIVSTSFKVGANYTVATVSGIGSIGTGVFPNPVYPEAGIALSTGSSWASSITNNSSNWNTAFSDRLKWDGGSTGLTASTGRSSLGGTTIGQSMFTLSNPSSITFPRFNANNSVSSLTASEFRTAIGAGVGTVTSVTVGSGTPLSINNNTTVPEISMAAASGSVNGYLSSTDWTTFNGKQNALGFTPANNTININTSSPLQGGGNLTGDRTISILSASQTQSGIVTTSSQLFGGSKVFKNRVTIDSLLFLNTTTDIPTQILGLNTTGGVNSVGRFTLGSGLNITLGGTLQADTSFLFTQSDTLSLNLTSRFASKQNTLSGTGFVKASGTSITYDNSSYLRTGLADSTYLKLTGGTLTGGFSVATTGVPFTVNSTNLNTNKITLSDNGTIRSYLGANNTKLFTVANPSTTEFYSIDTNGVNNILGFGVPLNINSLNSNINKIALYDNGSITGYIASNSSKPFVVNNNSTNEVFYVTESGNANFTGNITEAGNNVLTSADTTSMLLPYLRKVDTVSLSSRIDSKFNSSGGTISGAVTLSTTTATPTTLLGKDGSNVVGTVTTVAQTGLFGRGSVTNAVTDANGNITVAHGFGFTPIMAFANLPAQTANTVNVKSVDGTNIVFVVRDGATFTPLNTQTVSNIQFFAIK